MSNLNNRDLVEAYDIVSNADADMIRRVARNPYRRQGWLSEIPFDAVRRLRSVFYEIEDDVEDRLTEIANRGLAPSRRLTEVEQDLPIALDNLEEYIIIFGNGRGRDFLNKMKSKMKLPNIFRRRRRTGRIETYIPDEVEEFNTVMPTTKEEKKKEFFEDLFESQTRETIEEAKKRREEAINKLVEFLEDDTVSYEDIDKWNNKTLELGDGSYKLSMNEINEAKKKYDEREAIRASRFSGLGRERRQIKIKF